MPEIGERMNVEHVTLCIRRLLLSLLCLLIVDNKIYALHRAHTTFQFIIVLGIFELLTATLCSSF